MGVMFPGNCTLTDTGARWTFAEFTIGGVSRRVSASRSSCSVVLLRGRNPSRNAAASNAVQKMRRGQRYSLSFYLRQEIPEWDPKHPLTGYVLTGGNRLAPEEFQTFEYAEVPFDFEKTGFRLYQVRPSIGGAPGGGETK